MTDFLDRIAEIASHRITHLVDVYEGQSDVALHQHIRAKRRERALNAKAFKLVYLDTNAWKCFADFKLGKTELTPQMQYFAAMVERAAASELFAFPIGAPTLLELDAMTDGTTRDSLCQVVDQLSRGMCILPLSERLDTELRQIKTNSYPAQEDWEHFLCSPVELLGIPHVQAHEAWPIMDKLAFDKAFYDALSELPFSVLLEVGRDELEGKWDNFRGIDELNAHKVEQQALAENLNTAIAFELRDVIRTWFNDEGITLSIEDLSCYAIVAMNHWRDNENTKSLPTLRILGSTHGLMRFDPQRKYKQGDLNDFIIAASALPIASAFFTDRKLKNLLADKRIKVRQYSSCDVVGGFEEMGRYLEQHL
jgi:hypothetical protein